MATLMATLMAGVMATVLATRRIPLTWRTPHLAYPLRRTLA
jgi:hypothetical protein